MSRSPIATRIAQSLVARVDAREAAAQDALAAFQAAVQPLRDRAAVALAALDAWEADARAMLRGVLEVLPTNAEGAVPVNLRPLYREVRDGAVDLVRAPQQWRKQIEQQVANLDAAEGETRRERRRLSVAGAERYIPRALDVTLRAAFDTWKGKAEDLARKFEALGGRPSDDGIRADAPRRPERGKQQQAFADTSDFALQGRRDYTPR
jgi:hypothetical protein